MSILASVNLGKRHRYGQISKLLYLTDGLHIPKMYDGTSLVNWGIYAPTTAPTVAASSTGSNALDLCEALWTPASVVVDSAESAWTLATGISNSLCTVSADAKVGTFSALTLLGYTVEPISSKTVLMLHFDGVDGATSFTDSSASAHTMSRTGSAQIDTAQSVFGGSSCLFDGSGDAVIANDTSDWDWGTGDYTMDCRAYLNSIGTKILMVTGGGAGGGSAKGVALTIYAGAPNGFLIYHNGSAVCTFPTAALTAGGWHHIRLTRASGVVRLWLDGSLITPSGYNPTNAALDVSGGTEGAAVGGHFSTAAFSIDGWMDEVRMDKGIALTAADVNIIVPNAPYGSFTAPATDPLGITGTVSYKDITPADYSGYYGVQFWIKALKTMQANQAALLICDNAGGANVLERIDLPVLPADTWAQVTYKFQNPAALTSVASIALTISADLGQNAFWIDDVRAIRCLISLETDPALLVQGASSMRFEIPGNVPSGTLLAYKDFASTNMTGDTVVLMSVRCNRALGSQQFKYLLDDTAGCVSPLESIYLTPNLAADTWHSLNLSLANPAALGAVISEGLYLNDRNIAPCTLWVDNILRAVSTSGNLTGRYFAWVSYYASKYDRESDLSPISGVVDCQGQGILLTNIPVSTDSQVDMRRIYRSAAGGTVPYLDSTINDNTTTTLTLNKSDAAILASTRHPSLQAGSGKFEPPPAAPYLVQRKNRFTVAGSIPYTRGTVEANNGSATFTFSSAQLDSSFIGRTIQIIGDTNSYLIQSVNAGAKTCVARPIDDLVSGTYRGTSGSGKSYYIYSTAENTVFTSYIDDDDVPRPHGFPIEFAQDILEGGADDHITGLGIVGDAILVTKLASAHILEGNYPPYNVTKISSVVGCISHDTIIQDERANAMWLAGKQGIAYSDGFNVAIVSEKVSDIFTGEHALGLNTAQYANAHAVYDSTAKIYYLFCASKTSSTNDICIAIYKPASDPQTWEWYYFTGIEAASSSIIYDANNVGTIYIGDYDGFMYQLNSGWYDGASGGTLSGTPTAAGASTLTDAGATFYTTGSGLRNVPLLMYKVSTGETYMYKITSNNATQLTISGSFSPALTTLSDWKYYIGGYELDWKSKQFELLRPTDKKLLMDAVMNNYVLSASQKMRIQLLKNLAGTQIANQLRDLSEGEEQILLVRERVEQAQWEISGFVHGQNVRIVSLGLRLKARGIR